MVFLWILASLLEWEHQRVQSHSIIIDTQKKDNDDDGVDWPQVGPEDVVVGNHAMGDNTHTLGGGGGNVAIGSSALRSTDGGPTTWLLAAVLERPLGADPTMSPLDMRQEHHTLVV